MQFDHTCPPEEKLCNISRIHSRAGSRTNLQNMLDAELAKGEFVCVNCHRIRTMARAGFSSRLEYLKNPLSAKLTLPTQYLYGYLKNSHCTDCATSNFLVLEFDHVKNKKLYTLSMMVNRKTFSVQDIEQEISKCEVRCGNCHSKKTAFRSRGEEQTNQEQKEPTTVLCGCGQRKARTAKQCRSCLQAQNTANAIKRYGSIEEVLSYLQANSYVAAGKKYGVSDNAVRKWVTKNGYNAKTFLLLNPKNM